MGRSGHLRAAGSPRVLQRVLNLVDGRCAATVRWVVPAARVQRAGAHRSPLPGAGSGRDRYELHPEVPAATIGSTRSSTRATGCRCAGRKHRAAVGADEMRGGYFVRRPLGRRSPISAVVTPTAIAQQAKVPRTTRRAGTPYWSCLEGVSRTEAHETRSDGQANDATPPQFVLESQPTQFHSAGLKECWITPTRRSATGA